MAPDSTVRDGIIKHLSSISLLPCGDCICHSDAERDFASLCIYTYSHAPILNIFVTFPWEIRVLLLYWLTFKLVYVYVWRAASQNFPLGHVETCRVLRTESSFNPLVLYFQQK